MEIVRSGKVGGRAGCFDINDANLFIGEALFAEETARSRDARVNLAIPSYEN